MNTKPIANANTDGVLTAEHTVPRRLGLDPSADRQTFIAEFRARTGACGGGAAKGRKSLKHVVPDFGDTIVTWLAVGRTFAGNS